MLVNVKHCGGRRSTVKYFPSLTLDLFMPEFEGVADFILLWRCATVNYI